MIRLFLKNLFIDLSFFKECIQNKAKLHFLNIRLSIFFDYLILKIVFTKFFELDNGFKIENIEEVPNKEEIHPDVIIPFHISKLNVSKKYIGLSHLCCYGCMTFVSSLGFEFRGINRKFEIIWKSPKIELHSCP